MERLRRRFAAVSTAFRIVVVGSFGLESQLLHSQVPRVLDMRCPGPGVGALSLPLERAVMPRFVGDVSGGGRDDFLVPLKPAVQNACVDLALVFGGPLSLFASGPDIEEESLM